MIHVNEEIEKSVFINAPVFVVWNHLTIPEQMKKWMLDTHMEMDVFTTWQVGSPITLRGNLHGMPFENTGKILKNELEQVLQYTHLSSLSELPDKPENYCVLTFILKPMDSQTELTLRITNFPTETIFKHLRFYWLNALEILKRQIDAGSAV